MVYAPGAIATLGRVPLKTPDCVAKPSAVSDLPVPHETAAFRLVLTADPNPVLANMVVPSPEDSEGVATLVACSKSAFTVAADVDNPMIVLGAAEVCS